MKTFWLFVSGMLMSFPFYGTAQEQNKSLTIEEAVTTALSENKSIQTATLGKSVAEENYKQTNAVFLPQADVSYTAVASDNPLNAFAFKLQQQTVTASDFNPATLNNPGTSGNFTTAFNVQQPLLNLDMVMQRKGAAAQVAYSDYMLSRTKEQIALETKKAYLQVYLNQRMVSVLEEGLKVASTRRDMIKDRFDLGLVQKADLLNAEIQVKQVETQLADAKTNVQNSSDYLSHLMGQVPGTGYVVQAPSDPAAQVPTTEVSDQRADLKAMSALKESSLLMTKSYKYKYLPKINAFGSYYINDREALGFNSSSYLVGIQLSWKILSGTQLGHTIRSQEFATQKISLQLEEEKSRQQLEMNKALRERNDLQLKLDQQKTIIEQAEESVRLTEDRYKHQLVLSSDLLMTQSQLLQQQLSMEQLRVANYMMQAYLEFLSSTTN